MRRSHAVTLLEKGDVPMLGMTRWTPWTELAGVHRDLDSLFNRVFGDTVRSQSVDAFTPAADLRRDGDTWKVSLALPGIPPDKVDIDIVGRSLRVGSPARVGGRQPPHLTGQPFNLPSRSVAHTPYSQDGSDRLTIPAVSAIRSDDDRLSAVVAIFRTCARDHPDRDHTCPRSPCP